MGSVAKLLNKDMDSAMLELKFRRALDIATGERNLRKRELHVSDFTGSDREFCFKRLLLRYYKGEEAYRTSYVQFDGKWREEKWMVLMKAGKFLREYQPALKVGRLSGHPDFIVDFGKGVCVIELTGYDSKIDPVLRNARLSVKKRQCLLYMVMWWKMKGERPYRGFVIAENKGNCEFKIVPVDWDAEKAATLVKRVTMTSKIIDALDARKGSAEARAKVWRIVPR